MLKLTLVRAILFIRQKVLNQMKRHLDKMKVCFEKAKALEDYTPALNLMHNWHAFWFHMYMHMADWLNKITEKLMPSDKE